MLSATQGTASPLARPRFDHREQVVCGNVMSKGGGHRVCRDASGNYVDPNTAFAPGQVIEGDLDK